MWDLVHVLVGQACARKACVPSEWLGLRKRALGTTPQEGVRLSWASGHPAVHGWWGLSCGLRVLVWLESGYKE